MADIQSQQQASVMQSSATSSTASGEIVYGTASLAGSDESRVMSEKVQVLAASIYKEFELMIQKVGEDNVKNIMPLVVNVLESLDLAYLEKEEHAVELELLKEDNEQLVTQYEREKQLRRNQDQKCLEIEDTLLSESREMETKIESLESIVRILELKAKNSSDHASRLEEREAEQKAEYAKLHERYTDLFKTHMDHMERTKYLLGNDKFDMLHNIPLPNQEQRLKLGLGMSTSVDASSLRGVSDLISHHMMTQSTPMGAELSNQMNNEDWRDEFGQSGDDVLNSPRDADGQSETETTPRGNQQLPPKIDLKENIPDDALSADLTGNLVDPAEFASADEDDERFLAQIDARLRTKSTDSDTGMGREVENLIKENTELLETKNALNIVKNDLIARVDELSSEQEILREEIRSLEMVRSKMGERIRELESDLRETKEKLEEKTAEETGEDDVPMAQRKRFTRLEMARVLMERNQYKEKLMELQEAMKWTEMQRARKQAQMANANTKKSSSIWDFFSGLFTGSDAIAPVTGSNGANRRGAKRTPGSDPLSRRGRPGKKDFMDLDYSSERRAAERREQYRLVRAHVKKDESGRLQAYGWSIPASIDSQAGAVVPVPVFCRPLLDQQPELKIWCAAGVTLRGGRTKDGGYIIGESTFYLQPPEQSNQNDKTPPPEKPIERLDHELQTAQREARDYERAEWESSSLIWVCSSNQGRSHVAILDATNPNAVVDSFHVCDSHLLCVANMPGVREHDYPSSEKEQRKLIRGGGYLKEVPADVDNVEELGTIEWVELRKMESAENDAPTYCGPNQKPSPRRSRDFSTSEAPPAPAVDDRSLNAITQIVAESGMIIERATEAREEETEHLAARNRNVLSEATAKKPVKLPPPRQGDAADPAAVIRRSLPAHIRDGLSRYEGVGEINTAMPTIWMGSQNEYIYVHSAVSEWRKCLRRIKMADAVLSLAHHKGRVFAALANGTIAVFHRDTDGHWSDSGYHTIAVGRATNSVRSLAVVAGRIWAAYRNCVVVINVKNLTIEKIFAAHPRRDSQVRQMVWVGDGVWLSIRLDSTLRLYHAHTYQHLQDVDIEPYVTKMLGRSTSLMSLLPDSGTSKLDFSYVRTTAMLVSSRRLWIGTGTGVIISVPLSETNETKVPTSSKTEMVRVSGSNEEVRGPGGLIRVYSDPISDRVSPGSFIPYCNMTQAQLSFHGHKDAVKFFLAVPGQEDPSPSSESERPSHTTVPKMLVVSGGDGYIDFRIGDDEDSLPPTAPVNQIRPRDMSHLIVWEVDATPPSK